MRTVLTIAGFDPSSGAGISADLMVFAAHGLFGTSCVTSLTVQTTVEVRATHPVDPVILRETLKYLDADLPPAGIKIGMLGCEGAIEVVADYLVHVRRRDPRIPIVVDPVFRSSSGRELLSEEAVKLLMARLLPLVDWVTPNLAELERLTGHAVAQPADMLSAARQLGQKYPRLRVLATGGHINPPDDLLITSTGDAVWLHGERIETNSTHGTGCTLSSALLCRLVLGDSAQDASDAAKRYVTEALRSATPIGHGHGPLNHLWPLKGSQRR
jgi:hydroxymethylpyrimidine/phosphomethylpyrimidine kinase